MRFRPDIEGLRAVAVIAVVAFHTGVAGFSGGFVGVDVFFVLSGFLITSLMLTEIGTTSRLSLTTFYGRRARRLLPAATLVIAATVVAGWSLVSPLARRDLVGDALSATAYVVNWRFAVRGTDYFQAALAPSALQHYWSLAVEEQFYVIWPALIAVLAGHRLRRGVLAGGVGTIVLVSFVICQVTTTASQPWAYFGLHTRMWQLGAGALSAIAWPSIERLPALVRRAAPAAGLAAIGYSVVAFSETTPWPGTAALVPTAGALAVIAGSPDAPTAPLLGAAPMVWIGARSYSWYLWHWPALVLVAAWRETELTTIEGLAVSLGALAIGHAGYRLVEQPIRHSRGLVTSARRSIAVGLSFTLVCLVGLLVVRPQAGRVDASGAQAAAPATLTLPAPTSSAPATAAAPSTTGQSIPPPSTVPAPSTTGAAVHPLDAAASVAEVPSNLEPSLAEARSDLPEVYPMGCHADIPVTEPRPCELGDPAGATTAVLIGDSHAAQWTPALDAMAERAGIRLLPFTKSGCPAADVPIFNGALNREYTECETWRHVVLAEVASVHADVVILAQSTRFTPDGVAEEDRPQAIDAGWVATIEAVAATGADVVVLGDTPWPGADVPDCLSAHLGDAVACTVSTADGMRFREGDPERRAAEAAGVRYVDPAPMVCGPTRCPVIVGNLLVYRDDSHLATPFVHWLEAPLAELLGPPWTTS